MKLPLFRKMPQKLYVAFSGGVDSSALLHLLVNKRFYTPIILHVHHNTEFCDKELDFAMQMSKHYSVGIVTKNIPIYDKSNSLESFWSEHRNSIFQQMDYPVCTGHNLNDVAEWYVMSAMQGQPKLLSYQNRNIIRPFIALERSRIEQYNKEHNIEHLIDPTNCMESFNMRNKIRATLLPQIMDVYPGLLTTTRKLLLKKESQLEKTNNV